MAPTTRASDTGNSNAIDTNNNTINTANPSITTGTGNIASTGDSLALLQAQMQEMMDRQIRLEEENRTLRETLQLNNHAIPPQPSVAGSPPATYFDGAARAHSLAPSALTLTQSNTNHHHEPKVAQPEYFHGQRNKLSTFMTQVKMVIALQPSRFPSELSKIIYTGSFLRDTAFLWFQPHVAATPPPTFMTTFELFCRELKGTFGDPDEVATAERQLYNIRQRGSVASYVADFMRHATLVHWNDEAKSAQFYRGLKDVIKDELARSSKPHDFKELQDRAIRIDTRLFERQLEKGERYTNADRAEYRSSHPSRQTQRDNHIHARPEYRTAPNNNTRNDYQPRSAPQQHIRSSFTPNVNNTTRRGRLTPAEYQRRKDDNLCLYCGEKGHSAAECPKTPNPLKPSPGSGKGQSFRRN